MPTEVETQAPGGVFVRTVAVIGAGRHGRAFALRCARAGFTTVLEDVMPAKLRRAQEELGAAAAGDDGMSAHLSFALTVEDAVRDADLAIDFVPDELESKLEIFSLLDRMAPPKTVLCTPTRALSISDLASCTYRADRCLALRLPTGSEGFGDFASEVTLVPGYKVAPHLEDVVRRWLEELGCRVALGRDMDGV